MKRAQVPAQKNQRNPNNNNQSNSNLPENNNEYRKYLEEIRSLLKNVLDKIINLFERISDEDRQTIETEFNHYLIIKLTNKITPVYNRQNSDGVTYVKYVTLMPLEQNSSLDNIYNDFLENCSKYKSLISPPPLVNTPKEEQINDRLGFEFHHQRLVISTFLRFFQINLSRLEILEVSHPKKSQLNIALLRGKRWDYFILNELVKASNFKKDKKLLQKPTKEYIRLQLETIFGMFKDVVSISNNQQAYEIKLQNGKITDDDLSIFIRSITTKSCRELKLYHQQKFEMIVQILELQSGINAYQLRKEIIQLFETYFNEYFLKKPSPSIPSLIKLHKFTTTPFFLDDVCNRLAPENRPSEWMKNTMKETQAEMLKHLELTISLCIEDDPSFKAQWESALKTANTSISSNNKQIIEGSEAPSNNIRNTSTIIKEDQNLSIDVSIVNHDNESSSCIENKNNLIILDERKENLEPPKENISKEEVENNKDQNLSIDIHLLNQEQLLEIKKSFETILSLTRQDNYFSSYNSKINSTIKAIEETLKDKKITQTTFKKYKDELSQANKDLGTLNKIKELLNDYLPKLESNYSFIKGLKNIIFSYLPDSTFDKLYDYVVRLEEYKKEFNKILDANNKNLLSVEALKGKIIEYELNLEKINNLKIKLIDRFKISKNEITNKPEFNRAVDELMRQEIVLAVQRKIEKIQSHLKDVTFMPSNTLNRNNPSSDFYSIKSRIVHVLCQIKKDLLEQRLLSDGIIENYLRDLNNFKKFQEQLTTIPHCTCNSIIEEEKKEKLKKEISAFIETLPKNKDQEPLLNRCNILLQTLETRDQDYNRVKTVLKQFEEIKKEIIAFKLFPRFSIFHSDNVSIDNSNNNNNNLVSNYTR